MGALNLHTCIAAVTFMDQSWFPRLRLSARLLPEQLLQHVPLCFTLFVQLVQQWISAWWTSMDQWLHSLFCCFSSSTPYWFQTKVKPEGNQVPLMLPHISVICSNKYHSCMMNCTLDESHCDTIYWFLYDQAHFGVPVWQVGPSSS